MLIHFLDVRLHLIAKRHQHLHAFGECSITLTLELSVPLHIPNGHACGAQLEEEIDPANIVGGVTAAGVFLAINGMDEPNPLVIAQRMSRQPCRPGDLLYSEFVFLDIHGSKCTS